MTASQARPATIIVLAWNRWDLTERCLDTLLASDLDHAEVLVVDNGSTDETPRRLSERSDIRALRLPENLGFVRGNNRGIEQVDPGHDVVLLNNDVEVHQRDWLVELRKTARQRAEVGIVGCRLTTPDGRLLHAGTYMPVETMWGQQIGGLERDVGQYSRDRTVQGIVFACAFLRREVLDAIGPLSLDFESYFEDTDYCLRAAEAGFETVVCGGATLIHHEHGSTAGSPGSLQQIFEGSRKVFREKWSARLEARYGGEVLWQSILNFPTGYARSCREMLLALDDLGIRPVYRYVYGPGTVFPVVEPEGFDDYRLNVFRDRPAPAGAPVSVVYGQGDVFERSRGKWKIGYTMLEVDGFPNEWVRQANRLDEVWVPSEFNREGLQQSGVRKPIRLIPLGVNPDYFHPDIRRVPDPNGEFVFLSVFEWGERKAPELLLRAFNQTFSRGEPVRLVCKVINRDPSLRLSEEIRRLGLRSDGGRISYLFNLEFPNSQLGVLYRSADCFVSPSRGEGWNMPLMEAMACGLPVIATDWGPHREFLHSENGYPLRVRRLIPAIAKCPYYEGFRWADPDEDHLRALLREVVSNRLAAVERGRVAARELEDRFTWANTARAIARRLSEIASG